MQKYDQYGDEAGQSDQAAVFYRCEEVDARIAELVKVLREIANMDQADLSIKDKYESCLYAARSAVLSL